MEDVIATVPQGRKMTQADLDSAYQKRNEFYLSHVKGLLSARGEDVSGLESLDQAETRLVEMLQVSLGSAGIQFLAREVFDSTSMYTKSYWTYLYDLEPKG